MSKPVVADELLFRVERALESHRLAEKALRLERRLKGDGLETAVGESAAMREVFRLVEKIAPTQSTVLVRGESGTGKELVARAIHSRSGRSARPFHAINCAAIPENLLESELFGHEKGSFTGADARKAGLFEAASGSTLFLDEIGDLSLPLQGKILRALQEREVRRVGGNETIAVDVRVVAATNRDLEAMMKAGQFREDLFYRLNVIPIVLPPLRERACDIPALVHRFLEKANATHGTGVAEIDPGVLDLLVRHPWPGNIRQLESVVERAVLLCEGVGREARGPPDRDPPPDGSRRPPLRLRDPSRGNRHRGAGAPAHRPGDGALGLGHREGRALPRPHLPDAPVPAREVRDQEARLTGGGRLSPVADVPSANPTRRWRRRRWR